MTHRATPATTERRPARRRRAARVATVAAVAAAVGVPGAVLGWTSDGATVTATPSRGTSMQVTDTIPEPTHRRAVLISDSVLAAIRWTGQLDRLTGVPWDTHLESCRRLVAASCRGREGHTPLTAQVEIAGHAALHGPADATDVLVVGVGYNDWHDGFRSDFRAIVHEARLAGFTRIIWLTYRTVGPNALNYASMNIQLRDELATGAFPDVAVWDYAAFTAERADWFASDGVHLNALGARAVADWLSAPFAD